MPLDVYKDWLGIPDGPRPPDHYVLLRLVQFEDDAEKIRANYKKLNGHVRKYATGQFIDESQALLNEMAKAMLCLTDLERKREYDQTLGREFEADTSGPKTLDVILLDQKHVSPAQAQEARDYAERAGLELRDAFVQLKMVSPDVAAQALALELGLPYVDLADMHPDDDVLDQVPKTTVKQNSILPLFIDEGVLLVACVTRLEHELEDELRMRFNVSVRTVLAAPLAISQAISKYYAPGARNERAAATVENASGKKDAGKKDAGKSKKAELEPKAKPKKRHGRRTPEEVRNDRMVGIIIVNFSFLAAYLLDAFILEPGALFQPLWPYFVIPGVAALVAWQVYWKN